MWAWAGIIASLAVVVGAYLWTRLSGHEGDAAALSQRGRVVVAGGDPLSVGGFPGTELIAMEEAPAVARALAGTKPDALVAALEADKASGLLLQVSDREQPAGSLGERLASFGHVEGTRGIYLSPRYAFYGPEPSHRLSSRHRVALATVARGILAGKAPPRVSSFPGALKRVTQVEVMVLLRQGERPRLWRSARGNSLARALITAATVARKRWVERSQAMGGKIDEVLPGLTVDVCLLGDDGTVGSEDPLFINRVFAPEHGVAYERKGAWRYLLPEATREKGQGKASRAYRHLFEQDGLPEDSFGRHDLRLYRLRVHTVATSPPIPEPADGLGEVRDPTEVIAAP